MEMKIGNHRALPLALFLALSSGASPSTEPAPKAARSIHLSYVLPAEAKAGAVAFCADVVVEKTVPGSYFEVCGFAGGYFGIQERPDKKVGIFSVWDGGKPTNDRNAVDAEHRVKTLFAGDGVRVDRFGGEGTGGHSDFDCEWKVGQTYKFYLAATVDGEMTDYDAWFMDPAVGAWKHVATFAAPDGGRAMKGLYSFIEDFRRDTKSAAQERRATYGDAWVKARDGRWYPIRQARFTASNAPTEAKETIDAGAVGDRFYLQTGGETKPSREVRSIVELPR